VVDSPMREREGRVVRQVSSRGQVTIDGAARKALNVKPGMVAVQVAVDGRLEVYFIPAPHRRSLISVLPPKETVSIDDWDAIRLRAAQAIAQDA
jgi:bifunctional DNA-binding transcriptional regulator/antitoxin component of YhaV-PrlF toxin-antitoxin module